jgi:hypothetical protein
MAASFVVKYAYHAELVEFTERGPIRPSQPAVWECDHAHDTVNEAVACAERHEVEMVRESRGGKA